MDSHRTVVVVASITLGSWACGAGSGGSEDSGSGDASGTSTTSGSTDPSSTSPESTATGTGSASQGESGIDPGTDCEDASDCVLDDDCCHCAAYPELPPGHGCSVPRCEQSTCAAYGVDAAQCVAGHCVTARVECDANRVVCNSAPPECIGLEVPGVARGCWTGTCVPIAFCDDAVYFNCEECGDAEMCMRWSDCAGDACSSASTCAPPPADCAAAPGCDCGGDSACAAWGFECYDDTGAFHCCRGDSGICGSAG